MRPNDTSTEIRSPRHDVLAIHVMRAISRAQVRGRVLSLEDLSRDLGVRKPDVRRVVSSLHAEGYVDAVWMRLTLAGFAVASSVAGSKLVDPRARRVTAPDANRPTQKPLSRKELSRAA